MLFPKEIRTMGQSPSLSTATLRNDTRLFFEAIKDMKLSGDGDAERLFHGRGGKFPGCEHLTLDWYPPVLFVNKLSEYLER